MKAHAGPPFARTMKAKLTTLKHVTPLTLLIMSALFMASAGATSQAADAKPVRPLAGGVQVSGAVVDPATGLPLSPPPWMDPDWPEPNKVIPEVTFDSLPLNEVTSQLGAMFGDAFDILIPSFWQAPGNPGISLEPGSTIVKLQLKNVRASEIFNAMNMMFEIENTPYHWELKLNGTRPIALLRIQPQLVPIAPEPPPANPTRRLVYFVGNLLGGGDGGGMTMEQLVKTLSDVYQMSYGPPQGTLQFHKEAQLLIVTGTAEQIDVMEQTLSALRERAETLRGAKPGSSELKPVKEGPKS